MEIPKARLTENKDAFCIGEKDQVPYLYISKYDGSVEMHYPIKGVVTPDAMRGIYVSERESNLELFLHFLSQGGLDRLWCVGELDKNEREKAVEWTKKVNIRYKK